MKKNLFRSMLSLAAMAMVMTGCGETSATSVPASSSATKTSSVDASSVADSSVAPVASSSEAPATKPTLEHSFINSEIVSPASYGDSSWNTYAYELKLFTGNFYELITTEITYGFSMNLSTSVIDAYGTYTDGKSEDGVDSYVLNMADEVVFNTFSKAGGFSLSINTASANQTYPTEMLAHTQDEKNMAQNKTDVLKEYGLGVTVYCSNNLMAFVDPNAEESEQKKVTNETASGAVTVFNVGNIQKSQIVSNIVSPASYGDSSWTAKAYYINTLTDNTFEYVTTEVTYGFSMNLSTTAIDNVGNYTYGKGEDGTTPLTLAKASDVLFNSFSKAGGFSLSINTASANQTYPTEMLAHTQDEKNMAQNKDDVINEYGPELTVWSSDDSCILSLVDPNAEA